VTAADVIEGVPLTGPLVEEWLALDSVGLCEPNNSHEWAQALLATHVEATDRLFTVTLRDAGRLVAIVPAVVRRESLLGVAGVATLRLLADLSTSHSDILRVPDCGDVAVPLLSALTRLTPRWDLFRVGNLLETNPVGEQLCAALDASGYAWRGRREQPSYFHELEGSFDAYLRGRSAKFRNYLRRKTRQLGSMGRLEVRMAGHDQPVDHAYRDLLAVDQRSWKHEHGTAITAVAHQREFYRRLCEGAASRGRLHLLLLYLNDRPIAYDLGLTLADRYYYLKTSFDESLRAASPATVLRARLIEMLIADGVRSIDFPAEPYRWEDQWADRLRWHASILVFNRTVRGHMLRALVGARDRLRPPAESQRVRHVNPRTKRSTR
jgi:CelD/BcsL family acetyltransferase involved in cellulose biosynthesis